MDEIPLGMGKGKAVEVRWMDYNEVFVSVNNFRPDHKLPAFSVRLCAWIHADN